MAEDNRGIWRKPGDKMKLIVMGQQAFGKDVLAKLLDEVTPGDLSRSFIGLGGATMCWAR